MDSDVLGAARLPPGNRADRFGEFVSLLDLLLTQRETSHAGAHYTAVGAVMVPGCVQWPRLPFAIAADGPRGMRLAARYGRAWVTTGLPGRPPPRRWDQLLGGVRSQLARLDEACAAEGRDPATLDRIVVAGSQMLGVLDSPESFAEASEAYAELGCTDLLVFWPRPSAPFQADPAILDQIAPMLHDRDGS